MKVAFRKKVLLSDKTTGRFLKITAEICNYKFRVYIGVISKVNLFNYTEMGYFRSKQQVLLLLILRCDKISTNAV